jgi:hypothetical protein
MTNVFICRSPLEIAEEELLELAVEVHNVSKAEAVALRVQRRVSNPVSSAAARELLDRWTGSADDVKRVTSIARMALGETFNAR